MKFNLKCLEFENFRGFKGVFKIEFPIGLTIIYGPVGVGKSSIVQAIQYALYGTQLEVKERIAKLIDLINEESTFTKVKTILTSNGRILEIERLLKRSGEIARETAQLIYENEVIRKDVDKKIIEVLNLDEDDFSRFVLITHRTLEGLIYGTAAKRSLTIDRLFGIEILENIYKAIPIRKLEEILEEEKKKLLSYRELPEIVSKYGSIENAKKSLEEMKKEFEELKKVEEELTKRYKNLLEKRVELLNKLKGVEDKYLKYLEKVRELRQMVAEKDRVEKLLISQSDLLVRVKKGYEILINERRDRLAGFMLAQWYQGRENPFDNYWTSHVSVLPGIPILPEWKEIESIIQNLEIPDSQTISEVEREKVLTKLDDQIAHLNRKMSRLAPDKYCSKTDDKQIVLEDKRKIFVQEWTDLQKQMVRPCGPLGLELDLSPKREVRAWEKLNFQRWVNPYGRYMPHGPEGVPKSILLK